MFASGQGRGPDPKLPLASSFDAPVHVLFARQAARTPGAVAASDHLGAWSYAVVERAAAGLATALGEAGVRRGDVVAIHAHRGAALVPALLGTLGAGAAFSLLDPAHPPLRLAAQVEALRPRALLALEAAGEPVRGLEDAVVASGCRLRLTLPETPAEWEAALPPVPRGQAAPPDVGPDDVAYVAFTSGSTGRAKGIVGLHRPLPHFVSWQAGTFGLGASDRFAMLSGLAHDPLLRDVFTPIAIGASLHVPEELKSPELLRAWLRRERVTALHLTPSFAQLLLHATGPGETLPDLRHAFFGGEELPRPLVARFRALAPGARVVAFYGATETPQAMAFHVVEDGDAGIPIGRGIDGVQLLVMDGDRLARPGEVGEIWIRTPYLARGYLDDEALSAARFVVNPFTGDPSDRAYRTGDLGRWRDDGVVEFAGRRDDQIKIRGYRIELGEVVGALCEHPGVAQASVLLRGEGEAARLVAFVAGRDPRPEALLAHLAERVPDYMFPKEWVVLDALPLTPNGKIDRAALLAHHGTRAVGAAGFEAPRDEVERRLAAIWGGVLGVPDLGIHDAFVALGGDSLAALQILVQVEEVFGVQLPMRAFLLSGSVAAMARLVRDRSAGASASLVVPLQPSGSNPPLFWVPGGGGLSTLVFHDLATRLAPDQPVLGLEADTGAAVAPADVPGLARRFVQEVRAIQPHGPYHLLGFSLGSFVAWEMAVQLRAAGERIGWLAVFDTEPFHRLGFAARLRVAGQRLRHRVALLRRKGPGELSGYLGMVLSDRWARLRGVAIGRGPPDPDAPPDEGVAGRFAGVIRRNIDAIGAYARSPLPRFDGRVTAILAQESSLDGVDPELDPRLAWRHAAGAIDVHRVPGNHLSVLEPPHVQVLAARIRACLEEARARRD